MLNRRAVLMNGVSALVLALFGLPAAAWTRGSVAQAMLANDGMTAWYTDPRAVMAGGAMFYSTVSGTASGGNVELHRFLNGVRDTFLLAGELEVDDHDNASILVLSTGQLCVFYGRHTDFAGTRYRVSLAAAPNIGGFGPENLIAPDATKSASYSHSFLLNDGNVYLFRRNNIDTGASGRQQQLCVDSEAAILAGAATFSTKINILSTANQRPYAKYVQNGVDRIDCFTSKGLPGEISSACPVYHMYMKLSGGALKYYKSDGTEITDSKPFDVSTSLTLVKDSVSSTDMLWTWGIAIGADGFPRCLSTRYPSGVAVSLTDIEYWHHRWTGFAWINTRVSQGNYSLYSAAVAYAPGLCFDGNDTSIIYMSENDSITHIAEIKKYSFNESNNTLSLTATITAGSANGNLRPYSPSGHGSYNALVWARGVYTTYTDYEMNVYVLGPVVDWLANPVSYEAETIALLARMSVQPSTTRKNVIDKRFKRLKNGPYSGSNIKAKIAADYMFQAHDAQAMLLDWVGTNDLTVVGSPTRTANLGLKGDAGGTAYLSGLAPNAFGSSLTQNSAHIKGFYALTNVTGSVMRRTTSGPPIFIQSVAQGRGALIRLNTSAGFTTPNIDNPQTVHHVANRTGASAVAIYRDGGLLGSNTDASAALDNVALAFGYLNSGGWLRAAALGGALTQAEIADVFFADWEYSRDARS